MPFIRLFKIILKTHVVTKDIARCVEFRTDGKSENQGVPNQNAGTIREQQHTRDVFRVNMALNF